MKIIYFIILMSVCCNIFAQEISRTNTQQEAIESVVNHFAPCDSYEFFNAENSWLSQVIDAENKIASISSDSVNTVKCVNDVSNPSDPVVISGDIIYYEDFEGITWTPTEKCLHDGYSEACNQLPEGIHHIYIDDQFSGLPPCEIKDGVYHHNDERTGDSNSWKAECQLGIKLNGNYEDVWISFDFKINPLAIYETGNPDRAPSAKAAKITRVGSYNPRVLSGESGVSVFNTNKNTEFGKVTGGVIFTDFVRLVGGETNGGATRFYMLDRCNSSYNCGKIDQILINPENKRPAVDDWSITLGDGNWHNLQIRMKMNSAPGVADGIYELYYDGVLLDKIDDLLLRDSNAEDWIESAKINYFTFGGNINNIWEGGPDEQEMYQIDSVCVAKTKEACYN